MLLVRLSVSYYIYTSRVEDRCLTFRLVCFLDLELLAQSDGKANNYQQPLVSSYHRQVEPAKQVSRFFNGEFIHK